MPDAPVAARLHLAPGASGNLAGVAPYRDGLALRGIEGSFVSLPRGRAEAAVAAYRRAVPPTSSTFIGGQSFGGRVASLLAAEEPYAGLVIICYPLHRPGDSSRWRERVAHWSRISCPVLLLSGDRDPFASIGLLRGAVELLPAAELVVYPGIGHGLLPVAGDAVDRIVAFITEVRHHSV
ncbi:MAG: dienelactone hydrolase family protein [Chloroflexota bacterium]|nr:dienelactone hydrolase family protein [Chloroflexota bacterium]